jgi:hypothetical protein
MGWREMEHKGETAARVILCPREDALAVGVTSVREGKRERERVRAGSSARPPARPRLYEGPGPSFYRCKERVQMYNGGVAIC